VIAEALDYAADESGHFPGLEAEAGGPAQSRLSGSSGALFQLLLRGIPVQ